MNIRREKKEFGLFILTMVVVGLLSLISLRWLSEGWVIRRIIAGSVGDALLVAALLAVTVDRYIKSDLIREASKDVHKYLVGYHLPEELKERIQEMMCEPIIRRDCTSSTR